MLTVPKGDPVFRILGIDPGTDTLGIGIIDIDLRTGLTQVVMAHTLKASKMIRDKESFVDRHGALVARLQALSNCLKEIFEDYQPNAFMVEDSFIGVNPKTGMILAQAVGMIRDAIIAFDPTKCVELIKPNTAKAEVGAKGNDKTLVAQGLKDHDLLEIPDGFNLDALSDHATDALAIALVKARWIYRQLQL